jgi:tetratricopeptide (TPR) repeat protein
MIIHEGQRAKQRSNPIIECRSVGRSSSPLDGEVRRSRLRGPRLDERANLVESHRAQSTLTDLEMTTVNCKGGVLGSYGRGFAVLRSLLAAGVLILICSVSGFAGRRKPERAVIPRPDSSALAQLTHRGVREMMDGQLDEAIQTLRQVEKDNPESPVGYLLEADATWWQIYYSTADLVDPDVFDVVSSDTTSYDKRFRTLIRLAIAKSQARIRKHQNLARSYLYEGMAYALTGRLAGLRAQDLATARAGKKMLFLLQAALTRDPNLADADTGIGLYNYFVATLPTIVKMLRWLIGLPGGSRSAGLRDLYEAANHGNFTRSEAKFYLAKDFTRRNELQFARSLELFQQLANEYPDNPFWKLMVASVELRLGRRGAGLALYRQILALTSGRNELVAQAVHRQVGEALQRQ